MPKQEKTPTPTLKRLEPEPLRAGSRTTQVSPPSAEARAVVGTLLARQMRQRSS